jgi:cytochrome P450
MSVNEPFDLYSTGIDADPFPSYANLRDNYPCYWSENANIWLLSRYDDVSTAAQDWATYSSARGNLIDEIPGRSGNTLGTTDPPRHDRLRAIANAAFAKKNIGHLVAPTIKIANRQIAVLRDEPKFDFVADFSSVVTVEVLFAMMGLPARDPAKIRDDVVLSISTDKALKGRSDIHNQAFRNLTSWLSEQIVLRRQSPSDDLITLLAEAEIDGDRLTDEEAILTATMFVVAGVESLSSFMSNFVLNLADFDEVRRRVVADNSLMARAVEESLRFNTSAQRFKRVLTRDVELHGQTMRAGDAVALLYGSANRDHRKFPNPDIYDLDRNPIGHLGFGAGKHFCLGMSVARLVTQSAMTCFLGEFPDFSVTHGDFGWVPSSNFRSPVAVPIRVP